MRRVYGEELKRIQIEILDAVTEFCENNNIAYWIDSGTLLGAVRHKGYIPWDDDIDIGMLRPDYDKFLKMFNNENSKYKAYSIDNNPDFYYPHAKVLDTSTLLYEPDKNGNKLSINIDVFVYDNALDEEDVNERYDKRDKYRELHRHRVAKHKPAGNILRRIFVRAYRLGLKLFPKNYFMKKMSENSKKNACVDALYVGNFTAYSRMICEKSVFSDFTTAEFEGKFYKIPVGYDAWLRSFYGDYMQLPPEEKRVSHHTFEAYVYDETEENK